MIKLIHYRKSICDPDDYNKLAFETRSLIIKLRKQNNVPSFERALFFTTQVFHMSLKVKESLSISYSPECLIAFSYDPSRCPFPIYTNEGTEVRPPLAYSEIPLVWPAFGHLGGSPELIITEGAASGNIKTPCNTPPSNGSTPSKVFNCPVIGHRKLSSPYIDDLYHQDDVAPYSVAILQQIASGAISAIRATEISFYGVGNKQEEGQFIGNLRSSDGISFHLGVINQNTQYSLSIGKRCYLHGIELMLWGYAWQDWGHFRVYQGPIVSSFFWPPCYRHYQSWKCTKEEREQLEKLFAEELCRNQDLQNEVNEALR